MNIRPLTQLREMITAALRSQTNIGKSFQSFFIETMELFLTHTGRLNFTQMARCGRSCESRFRQNFKKAFDWFSFNRTFLEPARGLRTHRTATSRIGAAWNYAEVTFFFICNDWCEFQPDVFRVGERLVRMRRLASG